MLHPDHFRRFVIVPALETLPEPMRRPAAVELLLGTALVESGLVYLRQGLYTPSDGRGRALGLYQMERATYHDLWRYLGRHPDYVAAVGLKRPAECLMTDLLYATQIARLNYWRKPAPLPAADDVEGLAAYWKQWWNSPAGAGRVETFVRMYERTVS